MGDEMIVEAIPKFVAARELSVFMDAAGDEWKANGGTKEILEDILNEE